MRIVLGAILGLAAILGFVATAVQAGPNGLNDHYILLPYAVVILAASSYHLIKDGSK